MEYAGTIDDMLKKFTLIFAFCISLFIGCNEKTDWKAVYDSLNDDLTEYDRTLSEEVYNKIISKCDLLIESSPEFRNAALMTKSSVLAFSYQYDEAVKVAGMIPDTASVFYVFRPKSVYINELLLAKAERLDYEDSVKIYKGKIAAELEIWISERKDSLYHALTLPMETPVIRNQHIVAFIYYLGHLSPDEVKAAIKNLVNDIHLINVRNENTDAYFAMFYEMFLPEYTEKDWALFVEAFPKSFDEFINLYGYDGDEMSLLYHEAYDHIAFLFSDDRILEPECLDMLLKLTHGFYWQADAATYLHMHVESMLKAHPDLISAFLKDKDDDLVKDFLKCAIATCHPEPENTVYYNKYLKLVELYEDRSPKIVRLFKAAHAELMEEWCE